jgi:hypothetical protein
MPTSKQTIKVIIVIIIIIIQFNSILYYFCAEPTATRPITGTAQCRYSPKIILFIISNIAVCKTRTFNTVNVAPKTAFGHSPQPVQSHPPVIITVHIPRIHGNIFLPSRLQYAYSCIDRNYSVTQPREDN